MGIRRRGEQGAAQVRLTSQTTEVLFSSELAPNWRRSAKHSQFILANISLREATISAIMKVLKGINSLKFINSLPCEKDPYMVL